MTQIEREPNRCKHPSYICAKVVVGNCLNRAFIVQEGRETVYIKSLKLENFRCYKSLETSFSRPLTVIVGENDIGKSTLLDAVQLMLGQRSFSSNDIVRLGDDREASSSCAITMKIGFNSADKAPDPYQGPGTDDDFEFRKKYDGNAVELTARSYVPKNEAFEDFKGLPAPEQKKLIKGVLKLEPESNQKRRVEQVKTARENGVLPMEWRHVETRESELVSFLPRLERISSREYQSPDLLIRRTFQSVASKVISPPAPLTNEPVLLPNLKKVQDKIDSALREEITKAKDVLGRSHDRFCDIDITSEIDFSRAVTGVSLRVDVGEGLREIQELGAGTQRRIWMGLFEWENDARSDEKPLIRMYDEPDSNLHFEAQRTLFDEIKRAVKEQGFLQQTIICTHSIAILDRAPLSSVRLLQFDSDTGERRCTAFSGSSDEALEFYKDAGAAVGLTNTALLYERAFLLVEGASEEMAIPQIYKYLFESSMREDGVILVNLHTCSAWKSVLEVLLSNRADLTHLLLDGDCQSPDSPAHLTPGRLDELLDDTKSFIEQQVTFVGKKELEDAFETEVILKALNDHYPREDGLKWTNEHVEAAEKTDKFSEAIQQACRKNAEPTARSSAGKPEIARRLAEAACCLDRIPKEIVEALDAVRAKAGLPVS